MPATHPRRCDMPTRRRLTQPQRLHAILEQGRKPAIEKDLPLIELRQVRQKLRRDLIAPRHDARKPANSSSSANDFKRPTYCPIPHMYHALFRARKTRIALFLTRKQVRFDSS